MSKNANFIETLSEFDAGILESKLSKSLADVAMGVIKHGKKGKLVLTLDIDQIAQSQQVNVTHKIAYSMPTLRGKQSEEDTTTTPMYANKNGLLSIAPESQTDLFKPTTQEQA